MPILQVEHSVRSFERWKLAFDSDPIGREDGGVRGYRISRPLDDPNYVVIDLEFDTAEEAEVFLGALRTLWEGAVAEGLTEDPKARILETVESTGA